jgi:hypothetical protein
MLIKLQSRIRNRDHMFDRDLILDELDSYHHEAKNLLLFSKLGLTSAALILRQNSSTVVANAPGAVVLVSAVRANSTALPAADIFQRLALVVLWLFPNIRTKVTYPFRAQREGSCDNRQ